MLGLLGLLTLLYRCLGTIHLLGVGVSMALLWRYRYVEMQKSPELRDWRAPVSRLDARRGYCREFQLYCTRGPPLACANYEKSSRATATAIGGSSDAWLDCPRTNRDKH